MKKFIPIMLLVLVMLILGGNALAEGGVLNYGDIYYSDLEPGNIDTWTFSAQEGDLIIVGVYSEYFDPVRQGPFFEGGAQPSPFSNPPDPNTSWPGIPAVCPHRSGSR